MEKQDVKPYIQNLLADLEVEKPLEEVDNSIKLFLAYVVGLGKRDFPLPIRLGDDLDIKQEIPPQFHTLLRSTGIFASRISIQHFLLKLTKHSR